MCVCVCIDCLQVLQTHPDVNMANEHGNTPLHYAAFWNFIGICEVVWNYISVHDFTITIALITCYGLNDILFSDVGEERCYNCHLQQVWGHAPLQGQATPTEETGGTGWRVWPEPCHRTSQK